MEPLPRDRALVVMTDFDLIEKMRLIRELGAAIQRQKVALREHPSYHAAQKLQSLHRQRKELMGLLPPLRAV